MKHNLISVLVSCVILSLATATGHSQSFTVSPDSGTAGQSLPVTIVGIGTHFAPPGQASYPLTVVKVTRGGTDYVYNTGGNILNATHMTTTLNLPSNLSSGWYDMAVSRLDSAIYTYSLANALFVRPPVPVLLAATPKNAYRGQTIAVRIDGFATVFASPAAQYTINFEQSGNVIFFAQADTFFSSTAIGTSITVGSAIVPGPYDISIIGGGISYHAKALFTVLAGQPPTIQVSPDTGISGQTLDVTITGQNNDFLPGMNASGSAPYTIALLSGASTAFSTTSRKIPSPSVLDATLVLRNVADGVYNLRVTGNGLNISTSFVVTPRPTIFLAQTASDSVFAGSSISISVTGRLTHFLTPGTLSAALLYRYNSYYRVTPSSIVATSDTTLSASFAIPSNFHTGYYNLFVFEPNGVQDSIVSAVNVLTAPARVAEQPQSSILSNVSVFSNYSGHQSLEFSMAQTVKVRLRIYDALGHTVSTLCDRTLDAGRHQFDWNAQPTNGAYFYELTAATERRTGMLRMIK